MIPAENIPGVGVEGIKERCGEVNSSMIYLVYCKNFVNATKYLHPAQ
jgi:hypothetical protein